MKTFTVVSGHIHLTDPCYKTDTWCGIYHRPALDGVWHASVEHSEGVWERVASLTAFHESMVGKSLNMRDLDKEIGVDSGQAGIFDAAHYNTGNEEWDEYAPADQKNFYTRCCDATTTGERWGVLEHGVVSSSGYGDGGYKAEGVEVDGKLVAVRITYITDEEAEDEWDIPDEEEEELDNDEALD